MNSIFRKAIRLRVRARRVLSGLCAAFMLATLAFSCALVAADADHDCRGHDCPICQEMQSCVANLQLLGSSLGGEAVLPVLAAPTGYDSSAVCAHRAPALTLQRLDVRFDE